MTRLAGEVEQPIGGYLSLDLASGNPGSCFKSQAPLMGAPFPPNCPSLISKPLPCLHRGQLPRERTLARTPIIKCTQEFTFSIPGSFGRSLRGQLSTGARSSLFVRHERITDSCKTLLIGHAFRCLAVGHQRLLATADLHFKSS